MAQRLSTLLVILLLLMLSATPYVMAVPENSPQQVNVSGELAAIRDLLRQAMRAYRLEDFKKAYRLSRAAYLDHFETIEIPLRILDADLTLEMEYRFADLRTQMQAGASTAVVDKSVRAVRDGLDEIEAMFSKGGTLAPALAFGGAFIIIFREGVEAVLIIAVLLGYLRTGAGRRTPYRYVLLGIVLAVVATVLTWLLLRFVFQIAPLGRELLEAVVSFIAVGLLFWVSFWLTNRLDQRRWIEFLRARAWTAMASGSTLGLLGLGFIAIYREGLETALFYEVLLSLSYRAELFVLYGFLVGMVGLGFIAWSILYAGRQLPIRTFLGVAVAMLSLLSIAFIGKGVRELQEAGWLNTTSLIGIIPRLPRPVAEFTGIHPTVETLGAQLLLAGLYLFGWVFLWWKNHHLVSRKQG